MILPNWRKEVQIHAGHHVCATLEIWCSLQSLCALLIIFVVTCIADSFLALLAPKTPPQHIQESSAASGSFDEGSVNDPARFRLPASASPLRKRIVAFLQHRLKLPEIVLVIIFSIKPWVWVAFLAWMAAAPIASSYEVHIWNCSGSIQTICRCIKVLKSAAPSVAWLYCLDLFSGMCCALCLT